MIWAFLTLHLLFVVVVFPFSLIPLDALKPKCSPVSCFCSFSFFPLFNLACVSYLPQFHSTLVHIVSPQMFSPFLFTVSISLQTYSGFCSPWNSFLDSYFLKLCWTSPHGHIMGTSHLKCLLDKRSVFSRLFILQSCHPRRCNSILLESFLTLISSVLYVYFISKSSWLVPAKYNQNSAPPPHAVTICS